MPPTAVDADGEHAGPAVDAGRAPERPVVVATDAAARRRAAGGPRRRGATVALRTLAAVLAGLLLLLAFPRPAVWAAAPLGVAALCLAVRGAGARSAAALALLTGLVWFVPLLEWSGSVAGTVPWLGLALLQALFVAASGPLLAAVQRLAWWPLAVAGVWVLQEAARDRLPFGGFPWGRLGTSQAGAPSAGWVAWGGTPLLTAVVALSGALVAAALLAGVAGVAPVRGPAAAPPDRRRPRDAVRVGAAATAAVGLLLVGSPLAALADALPGSPRTSRTVTVALVQGDVPREGLDAFSQDAVVLQNHVAATRRLAADVRAGRVARPDLVLWPENASDLDPFTDAGALRLIDGAVRDVGVPVLVGAVLDGPGDKASNAGIVWDPVTGPGERYVKRHPVPFGEYMPYRAQLRRVFPQVDLVPRDFAEGRTVGVLEVGPAVLGDVICFEVAYDGLVADVVRGGAGAVVVQTNNASFGRSAETEQQLAMSRLRAVEHGRPVLVVSTSGVSAVVDRHGRVRERTGLFTAETLVHRVALQDGRTPATRAGAGPEVALGLVGLLGAALGLGRRRQGRTGSEV